MQKISIFLVATVVAIALYFTLSGWSAMEADSANEATVAELAYDGYSEGINTVLYDSDGNINYTLRASRQYHYKDQTSRLDEPRYGYRCYQFESPKGIYRDLHRYANSVSIRHQ